MSRFHSSLRYKIGFLMLLLSLGPIIVIAAITLTTIFNQIRVLSTRLSDAETTLRSDVVGRNLAAAAADTVSDIDEYMLSRILDIRRWSEEAILIEAARQGSLAAEQQGFAELAGSPEALEGKLADSQFIPIEPTTFSSALSYVFLQTERPATPFVEILITEAHGINTLATRLVGDLAHADEAWWQAAHSADRAGIGILEPYIDSKTGEPVVGIALPILDPDTKQFLGVIRAIVRLTDLQQTISRKALSLDAKLLVFTTNEGLLVADTVSNHSPQTILNTSRNLLSESYLPAQQAVASSAGPTGAGFITVTNQEDATLDEIAGYARTSSGEFYDGRAQLSGFSGFGWGVIVAQPEQRALQVLAELTDTAVALAQSPTQLSRLFLLITVLAASLVLVGSVLISGQITVPLVELSKMAQQVQAGDLSATVNVRSKDEVGVLGNAFNLMTYGLRQRERERDIFGRVVSPPVREKLLSGELQLGGETRWVAVLFSDIRNFTAMSEKMTPQEVVAFLNEYLTEMSQAITPWGGYINNFIGDAIVAIFGAPLDQPDKEWRAVAAAVSMQGHLQALNQRRQQRGEIPIQSGIGISTGEAVAGQIGSLDRLLYTVIGDAVNIAARLEALTKDYPQYTILINENTAQAIQDRPSVVLKSLGPIQVKGRVQPVEVYTVHHEGPLPPPPSGGTA